MKRIFLTLLTGVLLALPAAAQKNHNFEIAKNLDIFNALYKELDLHYVDTLDAEKLIGEAIAYMLSGIDPYTTYYSEKDTKDLRLMTTGKYAGIGSIIQYYKKKDRCMLSEPYEHMPAAEAGLKAGDIILSIDGKDTGVKGDKDLGDYTSSVSDALRGEPGTTFTLVVERPGSPKPLSFKITRRSIQLPAVPYYGMVTDSTGYIILSSYTENCARDVRRAMVELKQQGAQSFILDLRGNGGGLLSEAVEIVNFFVPRGKEIVSTKGKIKTANSTYKTTKEPFDLDIPLAVLVDQGTASASEITSGALQDFDRAVIIGNRTYGKGLVQQPRNLPYKGVLKLTTSKYYIPSGRCIQAIDYKHRNADGSAGRVPDSLTHVFYTEAGREVRDGGGITPDIQVKADSLPNLIVYLSPSMKTGDVLFDFVTDYTQRHAQIGPAEDFDISDEEYELFKKAVKESDFTYDRQSQKALDLLKRMAKFEGYADNAADEFKALETKLTHNQDYDLDHWKPEIKKLLNTEIVRRYYYQKGVILNQLKHDKNIDEAIRVLRNGKEYKSILSKPDTRKSKNKTQAALSKWLNPETPIAAKEERPDTAREQV